MSETTPTPGSSSSVRPPLPHELTAEWTVRAQLTFARAGEPVRQEYSTQDPLHPVRVVYKWSTPYGDEGEDERSSSSTYKQAHSRASDQKAGTSFRSTNSSTNLEGGGNTDSAFGSPLSSRLQRQPSAATAQMFGTRCRSTCNIVVSAVADFLPQRGEEGHIEMEQEEPFVYHTTVQPEAGRGSVGRILALRDAFSQTSDTETKFQEEPEQRRQPYEQRRATTEALMTFASKRQAEEANTYVPTYSPTPTTPSSTFKSASLPRIPPLPGQNLPPGYTTPKYPSQDTSSSQQKKPRTVHIDVYCTGSEDDEEHADAEASSSDSDANEGSKRYDMESNSTRQTVLDNEQMLLRHQRISGGALPRRLAGRGVPTQLSQSKSSDLNLGHAITKSSTAEEVSESKQLLFRKHIGDQRAAKLATLRQKYMRQPSDDTISSAYPNSSRSTMPRDATCSSISSAVPSTHAGEGLDSSWKETDEPEDTATFGLAKSDSFDYENSLDRLRIRQMERLWSRQHSADQTDSLQQPQQAPHLQTISEVQSQRSSPFSSSFQRSDTLPSESDAFSETGFHTYPGRAVGAQPYYQRHLQQPSPPVQLVPSISPYLQQVSHFPRNRPGFLQFFGPPPPQGSQPGDIPMTAPVQEAAAEPFRLSPNYQPDLQRWKSEGRDNLTVNAPNSPSSERSSPQLLSTATVIRCGSEAPPATTSAATFNTQAAPSPSPMVVRRFEISRDSPSVASEASTSVSGYTQEHLEKTRRFGKVVAMRKPGHHVGPTKNPNCLCESCQRWLAERFQLRGRAFSLGERPVLRRPQLN